MLTPKAEVVTPGNCAQKWTDGSTCSLCNAECKVRFENLIIDDDRLFIKSPFSITENLTYRCGFCEKEQIISVPIYVYLATKKAAEEKQDRSLIRTILVTILILGLTFLGYGLYININSIRTHFIYAFYNTFLGPLMSVSGLIFFFILLAFFMREH